MDVLSKKRIPYRFKNIIIPAIIKIMTIAAELPPTTVCKLLGSDSLRGWVIRKKTHLTEYKLKKVILT